MASTPVAVRPNPYVALISPQSAPNKQLHKRMSIGLTVQSPCLPDVVNKEDSETSRQRRHSRGFSKTLHAKNAVQISELADQRAKVFTKDQLLQHYSQCIKLSQENKINHKNAFDLKLIEHMNEMLRQDGSLNFRLAGGTIFAGAKIYASRVDAVHSEIYKVLSSLGGDKEDDAENNNEIVENDADGVPKTKKRKKNSKILETNEANLRLPASNAFLPLYLGGRPGTAAIDAASCKSLMLNQTPVDELEATLMFDEQCCPEPVPNATEQPSCDILGSLPDICFTMLHDAPSNKMTCETLSDLEFGIETVEPMDFNQSQKSQSDDSQGLLLGSDRGSEGLLSAAMESVEDDLQPDLCDDESVFACQVNGVADDEEDRKPVINLDFLDPEFVSVEPLEYSYFKPSVLSVYNGPEHWRHRSARHCARTSETSEKSTDGGSQAKKREKKVEKPWQTLGKVEKKKLQPQKLTKAKNDELKASRHNKLGVESASFCQKSILACKTVKGVVTIKPLTAEMISKAGVTVRDGGEVLPKFNYENDDFCPAPVESDFEDNNDEVDEADLGFPNSVYNASESILPGFVPQPHQESNDGSNHAEYSTLFHGDHLISQPKKVAKIDVGFATRAKRIDVKKLKSAMWSILDSPSKKQTATNVQAQDSEVPEALEDVPNDNNGDETKDGGQSSAPAASDSVLPEADGDTLFSQLYKELPHSMPQTLSENLSVPLAFTCLLHLANEKNLKIADVPSLNNLRISHGD